jgi:hypothetical protein
VPSAPRIECRGRLRYECRAIIILPKKKLGLAVATGYVYANGLILPGPSDRAENHRNRLSDAVRPPGPEHPRDLSVVDMKRQAVTPDGYTRVLHLFDDASHVDGRWIRISRRKCGVRCRIVAQTGHASQRIHGLGKSSSTLFGSLQPVVTQ